MGSPQGHVHRDGGGQRPIATPVPVPRAEMRMTEPGTGSLPPSGKKKRIVLTTFGSLGDLHPCIAVALGLQARGHDAVIATSNSYRQKIEALGIRFRARAPDHPDVEATPALMRRRLR